MGVFVFVCFCVCPQFAHASVVSCCGDSHLPPAEGHKYRRGRLEMADYLSRPRNSTSLWRDGATGEDLGIGTSDVAEVLNVTNHAWIDVNKDDPCLHIQLVKRGVSDYTVLVDGLEHEPVQPVQPTQPAQVGTATGPLTKDQRELLDACRNKDKTTKDKMAHADSILIDRHRGLQKDVKTNTVVFSPCVVSVLVEDGYRLPQRCYVEVHQTLRGYKLSDPLGFGTILLGVSEFEPTPVTDGVASSVFAPYPVAYSRAPYVVLSNNFSRRVAEIIRKFKPTFLASLPVAAFALGLSDGDSGIVSASVGAKFHFASTLASWFGFEALSQAGDFVNRFNKGGLDSTNDMATEVWASVKGYLQTRTLPDSTKLHYKLPDLIRIITSLSVFVDPQNETLVEGDFSAVSNLKDEWLFWTWLNKSWFYSLIETTKSLGERMEEVEKEIEGLENTTPRDDEKLNKLKEKLSQLEQGTYKPQTSWAEYLGIAAIKIGGAAAAAAIVVPAAGWPAAAGAGALAAVDVVSQKEETKNDLDFTNVDIDISSSVQLHLKVGVNDDDCEDSIKEFVFRCKENSHLLGALASDVKGQIETLWDSIDRFQCSLLEALEQNDKSRYRVQGHVAWMFQLTRAALPGISKKQVASMLQAQKTLYLGTIKSVLNSFEVNMWRRFGGKEWRTTMDRATIDRATFDAYKPKTELEALYKTLVKLEEKVRTNPPQPAPAFSTRNLPHRVYGEFLFPSSRQFDVGNIDTETASLVLNQSSDIKDAIRVAASSLHDGKFALGALRDRWEEGKPDSVTRCRFVHGTATVDKMALTPLGDVDSFALVVAAPEDIRTEIVRTRLNEQINALVDLVLSLNSTPGPFDTSDERVLAMHTYAAIWAQELVGLSGLSTQNGSLVAAMEAASSRVHSRLEMCNSFVQATTKKPKFGFFVPQDVALLATQKGRDAATLARIAHLPNKKGVYVVEFLRAVATAAKGAATAWRSKAPLSKMPSEPLQSLLLFCDRGDGVRAFRRVQSLVQTTVSKLEASNVPVPETRLRALLGAVSASYPSNLLMDAEVEASVPRNGPQPAEAWVHIDDASIYKRLKQRLAALCFDLQSLTLAQNCPVGANEVDDIVDKLALTSMYDTTRSYYIPFGHGASPPFNNARSSSLMFGSVPVWTTRVSSAIKSVVNNDRIDSKCTDITAFHVDCLGDKNITASVVSTKVVSTKDALTHPLVVQYKHLRPSVAPTIDFASSVYRDDIANYASNVAFGEATASQTAKDFTVSSNSRALSNMVSSIAWNAERVLQCICVAAVHSPGKEVHINLDFFATEYAASVEAGVVIGIAMAASILQTAMPVHVSVDSLQYKDRLELLGRVLEAEGVASAFRLSELCAYVACMLL